MNDQGLLCAADSAVLHIIQCNVIKETKSLKGMRSRDVLVVLAPDCEQLLPVAIQVSVELNTQATTEGEDGIEPFTHRPAPNTQHPAPLLL